MSTCLVQQLFRQKIGRQLDPDLIDEVLFPLLRSKKDLPRELLLDIKLTRSCNDQGLSAMIQISHTGAVVRNILPFKNSSKRRRRRHQRRSSWGSIDILNELRNLKHPQIGYHCPCNPEGLLNTELDNYFIRFEEEHKRVRAGATRIQRQGRRRAAERQRQVTLKFVNDYLEDALNTNKRICVVATRTRTWVGTTDANGHYVRTTTYY